jgi:hypothetical protein
MPVTLIECFRIICFLDPFQENFIHNSRISYLRSSHLLVQPRLEGVYGFLSRQRVMTVTLDADKSEISSVFRGKRDPQQPVAASSAAGS